MKLYEVARKGLEPFLPPLYKHVRQRLLAEIRTTTEYPAILDVGGRKSPYTIGVRARVSIIDLPRTTDLQSALNLGVSESMSQQIKSKRSNIESVILGDMTNSDLPSDFYDIVVSVEVLEHVDEDERFVSEVSRVLKPGGRFIMTTPNGDFVQNHNPDHKRHYKRDELTSLLAEHLEEVNVEYAIAGGYFRKLGLRSWSASRPVWTASSIIGNIVNSVQSSRKNIGNKAIGTHHLIASARKSVGQNG
ncbi:MAG: class I SAM-dependent methyltransferase [Pyrinomonadaceae bacterium]